MKDNMIIYPPANIKKLSKKAHQEELRELALSLKSRENDMKIDLTIVNPPKAVPTKSS